MQYFSALPKVISTDSNRVSKVMTNLMARSSIIPSVLQNPLVYYTYDIQDGDTPEIVASKYYDDSYRYWIVLYVNQITDPQWGWPLNGNQFEKYIKDKYGYDATTGQWTTDPYTTAYEYQKIITKYDSVYDTTTVDTLVIDEDTYNTLPDSTTQTYTLPSGSVTITTTRHAVNLYEHEMNVNESKRNIKLLNAIYVDQLEREFESLMSQ